jgi:hypothetical protein
MTITGDAPAQVPFIERGKTDRHGRKKFQHAYG